MVLSKQRVFRSSRAAVVQEYQEVCKACLYSGQSLDEGTPLGDADELQILITRRSQGLDDELELVDIVLAREERLSVEQLRKNAAHRPAQRK